MVEINFLLGDELYYGFILTGARNCFLVKNLLDFRQAMETIHKNKGISLVIIDKEIERLLDPQEVKDILESVSPLFFEISGKGNQDYGKQITGLIRTLGVKLDVS